MTSKYGYITWWRGQAKWRPDKIAAHDAWYPKTPTRVEEIKSKEQAQGWWLAVLDYLTRRP